MDYTAATCDKCKKYTNVITMLKVISQLWIKRQIRKCVFFGNIHSYLIELIQHGRRMRKVR